MEKIYNSIINDRKIGVTYIFHRRRVVKLWNIHNTTVKWSF